ncbi:MAG: squalene/phytoene synthase family protein [Chthoniobacterales bacterium]
MDWDLLRQVSRSFYLSLRFLPKPVRETLALAYLLARASDTLADDLAATPEDRLKMLREFAAGNWDAAWLTDQDKRSLGEGERRLVDGIPLLLNHLSQHEDADLIREVLGTIIAGQVMDIERFSLHQGIVLSPEELDDYTYRVAGSVGQFWTRLCFRRIPRVSNFPEEKMIRLGIGYGKGLQLVNILRDRTADLKNGREYFLQNAFQDLVVQARALLNEGREYAFALRGIRLRFCCLLPYALGIQTLQLIRQDSDTMPVRVSRATVYRAMLRCFFAACMGH